MRIDPPELRFADGRARLETRIESGHGPERLWYSLPERFAPLLASSADAQLVGALIPAMARGEDITVAGTLSERLHFGLPLLQALLRQVMPFLQPIAVHAEDLRADRHAGATGVATGFSGGIDSFCVLADHHYREVAPGFRVSHLLCNNVGSHETGGHAAFRRRHERLRPLAERLDLPFIDVDSNLDDFYGGRLNFQQTHTLRNASVALLLGAGIGRFLYASAHHVRDTGVFAHHDTAPTDLLSLPLLGTESTDCLSVGSESTRVEKTLRVAAVADSHDFLDVCTKTWSARNCATCPKCKRTLLTLEIAGALPHYERVFDLAAWRRVRAGYIGRVFQDRRDPLAREIAEFASRTGLERSAYSRFYGMAWKAKETLERLARPRIATVRR